MCIICHICLDFTQEMSRVKFPKVCLWMCKHKHIKKCLNNIFYQFFQKQIFKKSHLNTTDKEVEGGRVQWTPTLHFSDVGQGKTKLNSKMRNLHRCRCLQKSSKYEKATKTNQLLTTPHPHPLSIQRCKYYVLSFSVKNKFFIKIREN